MFAAIRALSNEIYYFINVVIITSKIALILKNVWRRKRKSHSRLKVAHFPWRAAAVSAGHHPKRNCRVRHVARLFPSEVLAALHGVAGWVSSLYMAACFLC